MQLFLVTLFVFPFLTSLVASAIEVPEVKECGHIPSLQTVNPCSFVNDGKEEKREGRRTFLSSPYEGTEDLAKDKEISSLTAISVPLSDFEENKLEPSINLLQSSTDLIKYILMKGEDLIKGIKGFLDDPLGMEGIMSGVDFTGVLPQTPPQAPIIKKLNLNSID